MLHFQQGRRLKSQVLQCFCGTVHIMDGLRPDFVTIGPSATAKGRAKSRTSGRTLFPCAGGVQRAEVPLLSGPAAKERAAADRKLQLPLRVQPVPVQKPGRPAVAEEVATVPKGFGNRLVHLEDPTGEWVAITPPVVIQEPEGTRDGFFVVPVYLASNPVVTTVGYVRAKAEDIEKGHCDRVNFNTSGWGLDVLERLGQATLDLVPQMREHVESARTALDAKTGVQKTEDGKRFLDLSAHSEATQKRIDAALAAEVAAAEAETDAS